MGAAELLHRLHNAGLSLQPDGPRVIVRPKSLLTDEQREAIRTYKAELLALLAEVQEEALHLETVARPAPTPSKPQARTCKGCMHSTRYRTCAEPVAAGLRTAAEGFGIEWPPTDHAATCPAWRARDAS